MSNNTEFKWTVDLLAEFIRDYADRDGTAAELMEQFKESKQPKQFMFISEDGIHIYEGDKVCLLNTETWLSSWPITAPQSPFKGDKDQFKYFSCPEEADEYKLQNQPLFSLKEITTIGNVGENNPYYKKLVALAESKLK